MKTYKFKLYQSKQNKLIHWQINASASVYNHCIALHKRYYKMFRKHLNVYRLMKHIAKLRKRASAFGWEAKAVFEYEYSHSKHAVPTQNAIALNIGNKSVAKLYKIFARE